MEDDGLLLNFVTDEAPAPRKRGGSGRGAGPAHKRRRLPEPRLGEAPRPERPAQPQPRAEPAVSRAPREAGAERRAPRAEGAQPPRELAARVAPALSAPAVADVFGERVSAKAAQPAVPAESFGALGVSEALGVRLATLSFTRPTRVQQAVIPALLQRRDVLVRSDTGSGKTLAYLLPVAERLIEQTPRLVRAAGTAALVLVPTRELCLQVLSSLQALLLPFHWVVPGAVMGGENRQKEKARLRRGVTFLVATPGRLLDHLRSTESFCTAPLRWLVLDEADRLLDLGFEEDLTQIHALLTQRADSPACCTALLSATLPPRLDRLIHVALRDPLSVSVECGAQAGGRQEGGGAGAGAGGEAALSIPQQLDQRYVEVPAKLRLVALVAALRAWLLRGIQRLVVFVSTCESVEFYARMLPLLEASGEPLLPCRIFKLHGSLPQTERVSAFREFQEGGAGILVCTDVAARGLDFPAVGAALQLDPPGLAEDYVHRVGRTARVGHKGEALLFLLPSELKFVELLASRATRPAEQKLLTLLASLPGAGAPRQGRPSCPETHPATYDMLRRVAAVMGADEATRRVAKDAFRSHVRAYAAHPAASKAIFHVKKLHLGHLAAAWGLKEAPQLIGRSGTKASLQQRKRATHGR